MAFGELSLKGRALRWLAQREHSREELQRKLLRWCERAFVDRSAGRWQVEAAGRAAAEVDTVLDELARCGLLSDERAARSVIQGRGQQLGSHRLKQLLKAKGLDGALVASTLNEAAATEFERARAVWARRFGGLPADGAERARQARFLAGRGFDGDVIRRVVRGTEDT